MALSVVGQVDTEKNPEDVFSKPIQLASLQGRWTR